MKPLIKLNDITYSYGTSQDALSHINLEIFEGEDISIIGHNGSGKSTLGKIIISLLKPKSGSLLLNDVVITAKNDKLMRDKSGIIFQNPDNQFIGITVRDDVAFGLENRLIPREKMDDIINEFAHKVGVSELLDKEPSYLSGGQKQRVALAGILAMLPDIIVFDEALAMLDPKAKEEISHLINDIKKNNLKLTIIRITHDMEEALNSNRIVLLNKGEIVSIASPIETFSNEDLINKYNIEVPFIISLNKALKKEGLIDNDSYKMEEIINKLCK